MIRLIRFGIYTSLIFATIYYIDTNKIHYNQIIIGFIYGFLLGVLEEITSHRRFDSINLALQFAIKVAGILFILFLISAGIWMIFPRPINRPVDDKTVWEHLKELHFLSPLLSAFAVALIVSTYFQIEKLVGKNMLNNYLRGRYRRPKKEIRVFLFIDLKASTSLSERLGNDTYYTFLNDAIYEMSEAIIETKAEIYQYVGDEIVFTWELENGITNNNCLRLFEKISNRLQLKKAHFMKTYGFQPKFKGAMHTGIVLAAEIGHLKKEIVYTGDVLNTTSRMESMCNHFDADLLLSRSLFNLLDKKQDIIYDDLGLVELKGKDEKIELIKIYPSDSQFVKERMELEKVLQAK
ncbi:MAG: adenylate/guanylate cyclase domain-containing protein [Cyclobacteriaceae bacterium]|nr:adenylate/guanylate cyclase domain-containing protein [Cyclobacteriaceae bacterium]